MDIQAVLERHEDHLMRLPNVVGVGIGERHGKEVIQVLVSRKLPRSALKAEELIPATLDGYPTDVMEVGTPEALTGA